MNRDLEKIQRNFVRQFSVDTCVLTLMIRSFGWAVGISLYLAVSAIAYWLIWPIVLKLAQRKMRKAHFTPKDLSR